MLRNAYFTKQIENFLKSDKAAQLATGAPSRSEWFETYLSPLAMHFENNLVVNALEPASRKYLATMIQAAKNGDPLDDDMLESVDPIAIEYPRVVRVCDWWNTAHPDQWRGPHGNAKLTILRDRDGEFAIWSDDDPTKHGAWYVWDYVDLEVARAEMNKPTDRGEK